MATTSVILCIARRGGGKTRACVDAWTALDAPSRPKPVIIDPMDNPAAGEGFTHFHSGENAAGLLYAALADPEPSYIVLDDIGISRRVRFDIAAVLAASAGPARHQVVINAQSPREAPPALRALVTRVHTGPVDSHARRTMILRDFPFAGDDRMALAEALMVAPLAFDAHTPGQVIAGVGPYCFGRCEPKPALP